MKYQTTLRRNPLLAAITHNLHGKPVGSWPETIQTINQIREYLPQGIKPGSFIDQIFNVENERYIIKPGY